MINNFESITYPLTPEEKKLAIVVYAGMRAHRGEAQAITGKEICAKVNGLTEPRLRKIVNLLRSSGILPIVATSKGYYTATDRATIEKQIQSLQDRIEAIQHAQNGLRKFIQ